MMGHRLSASGLFCRHKNKKIQARGLTDYGNGGYTIRKRMLYQDTLPNDRFLLGTDRFAPDR